MEHVGPWQCEADRARRTYNCCLGVPNQLGEVVIIFLPDNLLIRPAKEVNKDSPINRHRSSGALFGTVQHCNNN